MPRRETVPRPSLEPRLTTCLHPPPATPTPRSDSPRRSSRPVLQYPAVRVHFSNLGCKLNQAEVESLARRFARAGHEIVSTLDLADLHIVNSCTVTLSAARDSRKVARRAARQPRPIRTVLTGCYVDSDPETAAALAGVDLVVPNREKEYLLERVEEAFPEARRPLVEAGDEIPYMPLETGHARALVKIEDGCNMRCSFCIIPFTRGAQTSRPAPQIVGDVAALAAGGYNEVVITGVQISSYRWQELRLFELTRRLLAETNIRRLRLTSIAPWAFDPRLLKLFDTGRVCRHFHLSLQSGCTRTLRRMRRPYTAAAFRRLMETIRGAIPRVAITTDVIVGFPGETASEFDESLEFCRAAGFSRIHVFPYSARPGTEAAGLEGAVSHRVIRERMRRMLEVAAAAQCEFHRARLGETAEVLWERERDGVWQGTTDHYVQVFCRCDDDLHRKIEATRLLAIQGAGVRGERVGAQVGAA